MPKYTHKVMVELKLSGSSHQKILTTMLEFLKVNGIKIVRTVESTIKDPIEDQRH